MKPTSLVLFALAVAVATAVPISSAIGVATARAAVSGERRPAACPAAELGDAEGPRALALPPGHPPLATDRLPPGHPPIADGLPPGHPPLGSGAPRLSPGHPPVPSTVPPPAASGSLFGAPVLLTI